MRWIVDTPIHAGPVAFTAISEVEVSGHCAGQLLGVYGEKRPRLIIQCVEDQVCAVDIDGHFYEATEIERLYPEAISQLQELLKSGPQQAG